MKEEITRKRIERVVNGDVKWPEDRRPGIGVIEQVVLDEFGVRREDLHGHGGHAGVAKSIAVELSCRYSGKTQREVGAYYGYASDGGVTKQRQRIEDKIAKDKNLSAQIKKLAQLISKYNVQV